MPLQFSSQLRAELPWLHEAGEVCHHQVGVKMTSHTRSTTPAVRPLFALSVLWLVACSGSSAATKAADGVSVSPANEVRQGQAGISVSFGQAAGGLSNPSHVDLEDLQVAVDPSSSDDHLLLTVTVPHGAAPGPRSLTIETGSGTITEPAVIDVTPISVSPTGQDSKSGTTSAPFRTLARALAVAGTGDSCVLASGTYDASGGEAWGYAVPNDLTISGDSASSTVLQGSASPSTMGAEGTLSALQPSAALTLQNLALAGFDVP